MVDSLGVCAAELALASSGHFSAEVVQVYCACERSVPENVGRRTHGKEWGRTPRGAGVLAADPGLAAVAAFLKGRRHPSRDFELHEPFSRWFSEKIVQFSGLTVSVFELQVMPMAQPATSQASFVSNAVISKYRAHDVAVLDVASVERHRDKLEPRWG